MRKSVIVVATGAVLLLATSAVVRFAVLPAVDRVPANLDTTSSYAGTLSMVNPAALANGDAAHAVLTNVPVTVKQHVTTVRTNGPVAVMSDDLTVTGPDGTALITNNHTYAVDRASLESVAAPAGSKVDHSSGLPVSFPVRPEPKNYAWWDSTTLTTSPAKYGGTQTHQGRRSYVYTASNTGPVNDTGSVGALPASLPKAALGVIAGYLPAAVQRLLTSSMSLLPDVLKLTYTSTTDTTLWVDAATGTVIDVHEKQVVTASVDLPLAGGAALPAVLTLDVASTDAAKNAKTARDNETALHLVGTVVPIVLAIIALVLLLVTTLIARRSTAGGRAAAPEPSTPAHDGNTFAVPALPRDGAADDATQIGATDRDGG
jgi:DUF3068 family protein